MNTSDLPLAAALRGRFHSVEPLRLFLEAGNAVLTVRSEKTGTRFTYRFRRPDPTPEKPKRPIWVSVLTGSDNNNNYSYACSLFPPDLHSVRYTSRSRIKSDAPSMIALAWFLHCLYSDDRRLHALLFELAEVWHEGRCGRCGRKLTVPESIESGFGPDCAGRMS